ncbi:MAG: amidohydrolase family protein [Pseudomonadota bacterium]
MPAHLTLAQTTVDRGGELSIDVSTQDARLAMDLLGGLWTLGKDGGEAWPVVDPTEGVKRPQWSPDGTRILFTTQSQDGTRVEVVDPTNGDREVLVPSERGGRDAAWHPSGTRIVFTAPRGDRGLDVFEKDLGSGLVWSLTAQPGDELQPAWSPSGRDLAYVHYYNGQWSLMLRRFGQPDGAVFVSSSEIAAPAWRPDGTLLSFYHDANGEGSQQIAILSEPPLVRPIIAGENAARTPLRWLNRQRYLYVADGQIRSRDIDGWSQRPLAFRATVKAPASREPLLIGTRTTPNDGDTPGRIVIRAGRLFDGLSRDYRRNLDVLVEDGRIAEVTPRRDWEDAPIVDLGAATLMPGFIDVYGALPENAEERFGAELLSWGVTTLVAPQARPELAAAWNAEQAPGPRLFPVIGVAPDVEQPDDAPFLLSANESANDDDTRALVDAWRERGRPVIANGWSASTALGTNALLGAHTLPTAALGADNVRLETSGTLLLISALADARTPGLEDLFAARQAVGRRLRSDGLRRLGGRPELRPLGQQLVVGTLPNRLPPGLALHAELRAMVAAGLPTVEALATGGVNAARLLGLGGQIGEISPGARADMVLIAGDPLVSIAHTQNIVGIVRGGRFFSLSNLIERGR